MARNRFYNKGYPKHGAAATAIQRKWRGRKRKARPRAAFYGPRPAKKSNLEIKYTSSAITTTQWKANAASSTNVKNSLLLIPVQCQSKLIQGVGSGKVVGESLVPRYCKMKLTVDMSGIDTIPYCNVHLSYGFIKSTGNKANLNLASETDWKAGVTAYVGHELADSQITSDYLAWEQRSRNIVFKSYKKKLRFDLMAKGYWNNSALSTQPDVVSPALEIPIDFTKCLPKGKTKLTPLNDASGYVMNDCWIPFTLLTCDELVGTTEYISVGHSSRFYYSDP